MAGPAVDTTLENPALARQAAILARPMTPEREMANAMRALAIDAVEAANSGHPGLPMGMADVATVLWTRFLKFDAADPRWPDRDRFVLSAGHGSMLLYSLLHLTGHAGMDIDDLRRFRQLHSPAAGHPEYGEHPGIETTTGPLGQGIATAVGMALAERMLAARFGRSPGRSPHLGHRLRRRPDGGHQPRGDRPRRPPAARQADRAVGRQPHLDRRRHRAVPVRRRAAAASPPPAGRSSAVDGHDPAQIAAALSFAVRSKKPTLIACRTIIGFGAPTKAGTAGVHGSAARRQGSRRAPRQRSAGTSRRSRCRTS